MNLKIIKNHIVFQAHDVGRFATVFPDMKHASIGGVNHCAVPYSLEHARILNNLDIKAPSPIREEYDWPGRYPPRWYQKDTAEFFSLFPRSFCLSAPRTGKTLSSLWAADYLIQKKNIRKVLIVAPLSTLWDVWEQNIFESFPLRSYAVLYGSKAKRLDLLNKDCMYYIVNHHGVAIIEQVLAKRPDIDLIIIDEVAVFRNPGTKTLFKPLDRVINRQGIVRSAWGLTGTPTPNEPVDAYGIAKLICPNNYISSRTSFKRLTMLQINKFKWVPLKSASQTVSKVLRPSIRFERSVCSDMEPVLIERRTFLSQEQTKAYSMLNMQAATELRSKVVTAVNAAVLVSKIIQVACGVVIAADGSLVNIDFGPRLEVLRELIRENNEKVLVFVPFTGVLNALAAELRKDWSVEIIDGSVTARNRTTVFRDFRSKPDPHILVCHPQTMAHGLDLTAASLSIWYAPYMNSEYYQQANARIDGSKQTVKMDIAHIYATGEEKRIYKGLMHKENLQGVALDILKAKGRQLCTLD